MSGMSANKTALHSSPFVKVIHYKLKYGLQHGTLAHTEQQAMKGKKIASSNRKIKNEKQETLMTKPTTESH